MRKIFEDFKDLAKVKSRTSSLETPTQQHVKSMVSKYPNFHFDKTLQDKHQAELKTQKEKPVIKGQSDNDKSLFDKLKAYTLASKDKGSATAKRGLKVLSRKVKEKKPIPVSVDTKKHLVRQYNKMDSAPLGDEIAQKRQVNRLQRRSLKNSEDAKKNSPTNFSLKTSKLGNIVNQRGFSGGFHADDEPGKEEIKGGLIRHPKGQGMISRIMSGMVSKRKPKDLEIKKDSEYFNTKVLPTSKESTLSKGASSSMIERMKRNKLFNRSMDGKTKVVMTRKTNAIIDPNKAAKEAKKDTKSGSSRIKQW